MSFIKLPFKPSRFAHYRDNCPEGFKEQLAEIIKREDEVWTKKELYFLLVYSYESFGREVNYNVVAAKMNLKLHEISLYRPAGYFTPQLCETHVKSQIAKFTKLWAEWKFDEVELIDQLRHMARHYQDQDIIRRKAFLEVPENVECLKMYKRKNIRGEKRAKIMEVVEKYTKFITKYADPNIKEFANIEDLLESLPQEATFLPFDRQGSPTLSVIVRPCDTTSLSPRSASVSPPVNTTAEKLVPAMPPKEVLPPPRPLPPAKEEPPSSPMNFEEVKPTTSPPKAHQPLASQTVIETPPKRPVGRPRSSEIKKGARSSKEPSFEPPAKRRKSQTPKISDSKESTPSSPKSASKVKPSPLVIPPKSQLPFREARGFRKFYTPPASPLPKTPQVSDAIDLSMEATPSSDASRASSRLSSFQPSAVPSARSSEERGKTESRQSQINTVPMKSLVRSIKIQTNLSTICNVRKFHKMPVILRNQRLKAPSKAGMKTENDSQTIVPMEVSEGLTWEGKAEDIPLGFLTTKTSEPLPNKEFVKIKFSSDKDTTNRLFPDLTSQPLYPLLKYINTREGSDDFRNPLSVEDGCQVRDKRPLDLGSITRMASTKKDMSLVELELLAVKATFTKAVSKNRKAKQRALNFIHEISHGIKHARSNNTDS